MLMLIITLVLIALFIVNVLLVEFENFGWTTVSLLLTGGIIYWCDFGGIPQWVVANGPLCIAFVLAYLVAGTIWSFVKWYSFLVKYREEFADIKDQFVIARSNLVNMQWQWIQDKKIVLSNGDLLEKGKLPLQKYVYDSSFKDRFQRDVVGGASASSIYEALFRKYSAFSRPQAVQNKAKIIAWIGYWPFSLVGTFINDPIRRLVNVLFTKLKATYQKMSDSVFKDFPDVDKNY